MMTETPIKCGLCPATFASMDEWRIHILVHTENKKPVQKIFKTFKCESFLDKKQELPASEKRRCGKRFSTIEALLQHRQNAKEHNPEWIRKTNEMRAKYDTYTKHYDKITEFKNITDWDKTKKGEWVPDEKYIIVIHIGERQKQISDAEFDPWGEDVHDKMKTATEEQKTMQRMERKQELMIWDSDAANPGDMKLKRERPRDYRIPRGIIYEGGKEISVCLHCGTRCKSIEDWVKHTKDIVIPAMRAYQQHKTALKSPNKFHSFKAEKHSTQKSETGDWEEPEEEQTSGKRHIVDEEHKWKTMRTLRRHPDLVRKSHIKNPYLGHQIKLSNEHRINQALTSSRKLALLQKGKHKYDTEARQRAFTDEYWLARKNGMGCKAAIKHAHERMATQTSQAA
jgi:hypothetical protein